LSFGKARLEGGPSDGHFDEIAPPDAAQILFLAFVTFHVARKS
jgi:hypothetical protein